MTKREKVIRGLECCIVCDPDAKSNCVECPYNHEGIITNAPCANGLMVDALVLLKERESRVMTKEEIVLCTDWVWCEYTSGYQGWYRAEEYDTDYGLFRWEDTTTDIIDDYGFRWRAWTSRLTTEQMRDTPWEVTENG